MSTESACSDVLPVETTLRVWDCLFYEGSKILLRVAIALVAMNSAQILAARDFTTLADRDCTETKKAELTAAALT